MTPADSASAPGPVLVIIPTYNEAANIARLIGRVREAAPESSILVVDDGSPDGTGEIADKVAAGDPQVHVLHRAGKQGLGTAYIAGFRWGMSRDFGVFVEMDADGSHQPEELPALLVALSEADLVLGSRYITGGQIVNWPRRRELLSRGANLYTKLSLGLPLHDATGGFRAFRRSLLEQIEFESVASQGYCFQIDLAWRATQLGARVVEVPITFVEREQGRSKMDGAIVREALTRVTWWAAQARLRQLRALVSGSRQPTRRPGRSSGGRFSP